MKNMSVTRLMEHVSDVYNVSVSRAYMVVVDAARQLGYPRPHRDGIWARDLGAVVLLVDRRLR